jgi:hypothetical protein
MSSTETFWQRNWLALGLCTYETRWYVCTVTKSAEGLGTCQYTIKKRFSDLTRLNTLIKNKYSFISLPLFPSGSWWHTAEMFKNRDLLIREYFHYILGSKQVMSDPEVIEFFQEIKR